MGESRNPRYGGEVKAGQALRWAPWEPAISEFLVVTEVMVNSDDEVWVYSVGTKSGGAWNSLEVFRESVVAVDL